MLVIKPEVENIHVTEIDGTTRAGFLVLSDGETIYWDDDEDGNRYYFIVPEGQEEGIVIYSPIRGVNHEYVLAAVAIETTAQQMEEGKYGKQ